MSSSASSKARPKLKMKDGHPSEQGPYISDREQFLWRARVTSMHGQHGGLMKLIGFGHTDFNPIMIPGSVMFPDDLDRLLSRQLAGGEPENVIYAIHERCDWGATEKDLAKEMRRHIERRPWDNVRGFILARKNGKIGSMEITCRDEMGG